MTSIVIRCEDHAPPLEGLAPLLEGAKAAQWHQLARAGAAGTLKPGSGSRLARWGKAHRPTVCDRLQLHRAMLGLSPTDPEAAPALCYAASINLRLAPEEAAWCCELLTHHDGTVVDTAAGGISTKESEVLIHAIEDALGSETRRWEVGEGAHHVLVVSDPAYRAIERAVVSSPQHLMGEPWRRHVPKGALGESLQALIGEAAAVLETHPINRVRVDLGENPANLLWLWGGGAAQSTPPHPRQRPRPSTAICSSDFLLRGMARVLESAWAPGPEPLTEETLTGLGRWIDEQMQRRDHLYVHLPIISRDPTERQCAVDRIDQLILKPLSQRVQRQPARLMALVDDRSTGAVTLVALGAGLPPHPVVSLSAEHLAASSLVFDDGMALFQWLTQ